MRDQLEELFARPWCLRVGVEVVQHHQRRDAQLLQQLVVRQLRLVVVRGAEMVEQVGDGEEERGLPSIDRLVRDRRRNVGLAAAGGAIEQESLRG